MAPEGEAAGGQGDTNAAGAATDGIAAEAAAKAAPSDEALAAARDRAAADKVVADESAAAEKVAADAKVKADADAAAAAGGDKPKPGSKDGDTPSAPDKYELEVPDGFENQREDFEAMAKRQDLTNEQAQMVMNALPDQYAAQSTRFLEQTEAHPEIGGEKLEGAQLNARLVLDKFLPADSDEGRALRDGMDLTGYGNWPPLVLLLSRIGAHFAEDSPPNFEPARMGSGAAKDPVKTLYDNPTSKVEGH